MRSMGAGWERGCLARECQGLGQAGQGQGRAQSRYAEAHPPNITQAKVCGAESKGWSALAGADVRAGAFVCLYAGEVVSTPEAARRLAEYDTAAHEEPSAPGHALLVSPDDAIPGNCKYGVSGVHDFCSIVVERGADSCTV